MGKPPKEKTPFSKPEETVETLPTTESACLEVALAIRKVSDKEFVLDFIRYNVDNSMYIEKTMPAGTSRREAETEFKKKCYELGILN